MLGSSVDVNWKWLNVMWRCVKLWKWLHLSPPPILRDCLKSQSVCLDIRTFYRMACPVYFHLFLPGNTGLYICTCVLWRVGCADITESLCDLILVTRYIFVQPETQIEINIWFNLPVHVLFSLFLWNVTEEQCWRSANHLSRGWGCIF